MYFRGVTSRVIHCKHGKVGAQIVLEDVALWTEQAVLLMGCVSSWDNSWAVAVEF